MLYRSMTFRLNRLGWALGRPIGSLLKRLGLERAIIDRNRKNIPLPIPDIRELTFSAAELSRDTGKITRCVKENGIAIITGFPDDALVEGAAREMDTFITDFMGGKSGEHFDDSGQVCWQYYGQRWGVHELVSDPRPIVNIRHQDRSAPDGGMVDVFKIDHVARQNNLNHTMEMIRILKEGPVHQVLEAILPGYDSRMNLYYNDSVTNTVGPHQDDYHDTFKVFVYLTNVPDERYGPYTFVPGSNHFEKYLRRERLLNQLFNYEFGDILSMPKEHFIQCTGKRGTMIISNQRGVHAGHPQLEGYKRIALVESIYK